MIPKVIFIVVYDYEMAILSKIIIWFHIKKIIKTTSRTTVWKNWPRHEYTTKQFVARFFPKDMYHILSYLFIMYLLHISTAR